MLKLLVLLGLGISAAVGAWQAARMRRRFDEPSANDRCIACDSKQLHWVAAGAYRCAQCGYEGGPGAKALAEQKAAAVYADLDVHERQRRARRHLRNALHRLMGAPQGAVTDDPEAVARWVTEVESSALGGAADLEEAGRAAGGVVDLAGFGEIDPRPLAEALLRGNEGVHYSARDGEASKGDRMLARVLAVRTSLERALQGVPPDGPGSPTGHRG